MDITQWRPYLTYYVPGGNLQEYQEHVFLDYAATGAARVAALARFEAAVRAAAVELKNYRTIRLTLAMKHHIWRDARNKACGPQIADSSSRHSSLASQLGRLSTMGSHYVG